MLGPKKKENSSSWGLLDKITAKKSSTTVLWSTAVSALLIDINFDTDY